ncbi:hypothetical protein PFICI_07631 [Pestalotiopsis fici W106-1]|uniref:Uncharacterized protein n=1 Tax=Pestalotiopsis fici (strain W106-1 / CGMCC3.15140) TaxID=1229662 RepID=W3X3W3_PESFW|nr:uncharacterized protein PFICI_07631 [Pestalotiopsis fici W106-1]ETS80102.1 hypothetical protein PFICI_07631 [Pestalotiopsis fici W106-1]
MSPNIQESELSSRKRSHDQFTEATFKVEDTSVENHLEIKAEDASGINGALQDIPLVSITKHDANKARSGSPAPSVDSELSSVRSSPSPMQDDLTPSTSPMAPLPTGTAPQSTSAMPPSAAPPAKKKRKTAEEKETEERERAAKKAKKEEEMAVKAKEKEAKDAAKAAKVAEKEEKDRKKKEEEDKKKRAQPSIFGFLKAKPAALGELSPNQQPSKKAVDGSPVRPRAPIVMPITASPSAKEAKPQKSAYDKLFQPFFVKSDVKLAVNPFQMDEETMAAKSRILDEHIRGDRGEVATKPFDPVATFQFSGVPTTRGKQHIAVKKIMAEMSGDTVPSHQSESQQLRLTNAQDQLRSIPVKVLSFFEDVRPAYVGTVTSTPKVHLGKLARRPTGRLLSLNYEYDSEAEWEEEEGEDLDEDDLEDEGEEGEEEMGDFLDDAEDVSATRPAFLTETEPVSTGICFENRTRLAHNADGEVCPTVYKYRMEFILDSLEHHHSIDPFSTDYWQSKSAPGPASTQQSKLTKTAGKNPQAGMAPPPLPGSSPAATSASDQPDWSTLMPKSMFPEFKRAIINKEYNFLTKVGIVDMLSKKFPTVNKGQVKATLDFLAERSSLPGAKKSAKVWVLRPEHALDKD